MGIRIVTDSTGYLPPEKIKELGIEVVPLEISFAGTIFREGEISNRDYYGRLRSEKAFPTTSQPPAGDFVKVFEKYGHEEQFLGLFISEALSGTWQSAETAAAMLPDYDITLMDSRSTVMGLGFQVLKAAEMARDGYGREEIINEVVKIRRAVNIAFVVDNLEYLVRGGRLGKASGLLGNLMQVKPILGLVEGKIAPLDKVRTKGRAVQKIVEDFEKQRTEGTIEQVCVIHVDAEAEALELREKIAQSFTGPIILSEAGPTIGSHVGPGTVGLIYY
ncbi:MAG: DegV family protein [Syntrophomonadaceae bacterium]|nr:DegV family protein [Syntrophomonadaceae bacterium]